MKHWLCRLVGVASVKYLQTTDPLFLSSSIIELNRSPSLSLIPNPAISVFSIGPIYYITFTFFHLTKATYTLLSHSAFKPGSLTPKAWVLSTAPSPPHVGIRSVHPYIILVLSCCSCNGHNKNRTTEEVQNIKKKIIKYWN